MKLHVVRNIIAFLSSKQLTLHGDQAGPLVEALQELKVEEQAEIARLNVAAKPKARALVPPAPDAAARQALYNADSDNFSPL